jgi:OOP family OmpA-OmpF porin
MSSRPVGKCVNFQACSKADSREAIPVAARDANPVCPNCSQPLLITTPIVNPRRNAAVAIGIVSILLLVGLGVALKHYLTSGSGTTVAVPTTIPTSGSSGQAAVPTTLPRSVVAAAGNPASTSRPGKAVPTVAGAAPKNASRGRAGANAGGSIRTTVTAPVDAPAAYTDLVHTADKLDFALYFQRDSGILDTKAHADLRRLEALLKTDAYRARKVLVAGFADNTGDPGYSRFLSGQRAQAVAAQLTSQGVNVAQTFGFGQIAPVGDNATREGREKNRRVEVFVAH